LVCLCPSSGILLSLTPPGPPRSTLFPYTTLFRSTVRVQHDVDRRAVREERHVLRGQDLADDALVAVPAGELVAVLDLRLLRHVRSEEHTSELQSRENLVCRLLLEKKKERDHRSYV